MNKKTHLKLEQNSGHKNYLWTPSKARLQFLQAKAEAKWNWIFLPGGPGLGSESLIELIACLSVPGSFWLLDLPGDGSNLTDNPIQSFLNWPEALVEAIDALDQVILVAHSSGAMYALSLPELEDRLVGLVIISAAPDHSWMNEFEKVLITQPIAKARELDVLYQSKPSDSLLKELTIACAPYFFTPKGLKKGLNLLNRLPYNHVICDWSEQYFDAYYQAKWTPKKIPTLILGGSEDLLTPLKLFQASEEFQQPNITIKEIINAGHFPWIEDPKAVDHAFNRYLKDIISQK